MIDPRPWRGLGPIFAFWLPLATTWLMMAAEGPIVAAVIARMPEATVNLAAFGVAGAFASLVEAPILMLLAASTALVKDEASYQSLRRFASILNIALTALMIVVVLPPVFGWLQHDVLELPDEVGRRAYGAVLLLIPWPAAIGYRRFHQGLLVRHGMTRWVAFGTAFRLVGILGTALLVPRILPVDGAQIGGAALSTGVLIEALVTGRLARRAVHAIRERTALEGPGTPLALAAVARFYAPLATTSILPMAVQPMLTFFMGRSRLPIESLAVFPVVLNFVFLFRCTGVSLQEVTIALLARSPGNAPALRRFARALAAASVGLLALTVLTGAVDVWFQHVMSLPGTLTALASTAAAILIVLPALTVAQAFQRGVLVAASRTAPISWATMIEVVVIGVVMAIGIGPLDRPGVFAAAAAVLCGQMAANAFLNLMVRRIPGGGLAPPRASTSAA